MRKILIYIFVIFLFIICAPKVHGQDTIKINKNGEYKILVLKQRKHFSFREFRKLDSISKIRFAKAEDINFLNHNLKMLRDDNILMPDMIIYELVKTERGFRLFNPIVSNLLLTREDSINSFINKKLETYFILREYK